METKASPTPEEFCGLDEEEAPRHAPGLTDKEQGEVQDAQRPRAPVVYEIVVESPVLPVLVAHFYPVPAYSPASSARVCNEGY